MQAVKKWHTITSLIMGGILALIAGTFLSFLFSYSAEAQSATCDYVDDNGLISGLTVQKRQVSTQIDRQYSSGSWQNVECGAPHQFSGTLPVLMTDGKLLPGQSATVTVASEANLICQGNPSDPTQYCSARVLLNGEEMNPDPDHFHWAPVTSSSNWGNYSFTRSENISCPPTLENILNLGCEIGQVELQVEMANGANLKVDSLNVDAYLHPQTLIL